MPRYRHALPQLSGKLFLTDGGQETTLIYLEGVDLPLFAAFTELTTAEGRARLDAYYRRYTALARDAGAGFVLEAPTWRASSDWGDRLGYDAAALNRLNRDAVDLLVDIREAEQTPDSPMVISGNFGPRGDGYNPEFLMSADEAEAYHRPQAEAFATSEADLVTAMTMTHAGEAIGIARAAAALGLPSVISFTLETDGRLPTGQPLGEAIEEVDQATGGAPAYYMINCAHPDHFNPTLAAGGAWIGRLGGLRANASRLSHAELDAATELDPGDPDELGVQYAALRREYPRLKVLGGCCGTDHRHLEAIAHRCRAA